MPCQFKSGGSWSPPRGTRLAALLVSPLLKGSSRREWEPLISSDDYQVRILCLMLS